MREMSRTSLFVSLWRVSSLPEPPFFMRKRSPFCDVLYQVYESFSSSDEAKQPLTMHLRVVRICSIVPTSSSVCRLMMDFDPPDLTVVLPVLDLCVTLR